MSFLPAVSCRSSQGGRVSAEARSSGTALGPGGLQPCCCHSPPCPPCEQEQGTRVLGTGLAGNVSETPPAQPCLCQASRLGPGHTHSPHGLGGFCSAYGSCSRCKALAARAPSSSPLLSQPTWPRHLLSVQPDLAEVSDFPSSWCLARRGPWQGAGHFWMSQQGAGPGESWLQGCSGFGKARLARWAQRWPDTSWGQCPVPPQIGRPLAWHKTAGPPHGRSGSHPRLGQNWP